MAFFCKRRHFCPSCHQKRVVEFGERLCEEVLKAVPHRRFVFSIPKILCRYFLYDRSLLSGLSRRAWNSLKVFFQEGAVPGAVIAIQSFGLRLGERRSSKIKPPGHRHAFCALPWPRPGLVLSIPKNPLLSNTAESSLQIELVAPGQAWPQSSISASELPPQSRFRREGCIHLDTQDQFPYTPHTKKEVFINQ